MYRRLLRWSLIPLTLLVATLVATTTPAAAHPVTGGWADNHMLSNSSAVRAGNIVMLWQMIIYADRGNGTGVTCRTFTDGLWGPLTDRTTRAWQDANGLDPDGKVGPLTWSKAESKLRVVEERPTVIVFRYVGPIRSFTLHMLLPSGEFFFIPSGSGVRNDTNHPGISANRCV